MSEKRKDSKGHVLCDGETYRKDGRYMYRYTELNHHRLKPVGSDERLEAA